MSKECCVCNKGSVSGNNVSHSNRHTKRVWKPNLKKIRIKDGDSSKMAYVCTRCLRSGKVERVV